MDFSQLPQNVLEQVQEIVFKFEECSMKDMANLSLVSKQIHCEIKPYMYCNDTWFPLTCKCSRQLQAGSLAYLCKPYSEKKGFSHDWRCINCVSSSKRRMGRGFGRGGKRLHAYGVINVHFPCFKRCNAVVKYSEYDYDFCNLNNCHHCKY